MGYLNLVGSFVYKEPLFRAKLDAMAENDAQLKTDGWAQSTKTLFYQATVPAGWTQDVSQNDKAIRVVGSIGGGGSGGTQVLSTTIVLAHSHSLVTPSDGAHTHAYANHTHQVGNPTNTRGSTIWIFADGSNLLYPAQEFGGSTNITQLGNPWASPGALTLSTQAAHNHGTPGTSLANFVFAYLDTIIGTKNAPGGTYTDLTNAFSTGQKIDFDPFSALAANDAYNLGNLMPGGTAMIWGQPTAPAGWTRVSAANDRMLRVVSSVGGGLGGSLSISSGVTLGHTHSLSTVAAHTHTIPAHQHSLTNGATSSTGVPAASNFGFVQDAIVGGGLLAICDQTPGLPTSSKTVYAAITVNSGSTTGSADAHTHSIAAALADFTLAYVDVIQCTKDSGGQPYPYTDMTAAFAWKELVAVQRLESMAENDSYIEYHTTETGSQAFFFMASPPAGWNKITSQHDKALRVVTGATGGMPGGGTQLMSMTITLGHTHVVPTDPDHTHVDTHTHLLGTATRTIVQPGLVVVDHSSLSVANPGTPQAGGQSLLSTTLGPDLQPDAAGNHNHGGATDSQLTDIALAYCDVIWCAKA